MKIDFNAYIGCFPYWENKYAEPSGKGLVALMDRDGIDRAVALSLRCLFDDVEAGNQEMLEAAGKYPDRLIPAVTVNPYSGLNNETYLKECRDSGAKVLKLYPFNHSYPLMSQYNNEVDKLVKTAAKLGYCLSIPVRLFMNWYFNVLPMTDVVNFALKHRDAPIVIDCVNYSEFSPAVEAAEQAEHIYIGTSALTFMNSIEHLAERIGEDRIVAGTCAPMQIPACGTAKVKEALVGDTCREKILGGNAEKLLGLQ